MYASVLKTTSDSRVRQLSSQQTLIGISAGVLYGFTLLSLVEVATVLAAWVLVSVQDKAQEGFSANA